MIDAKINVDGMMVLAAVAVVAVGYVVYKKDEIADSISQGTNLTSDKNYINRGVIHLLGLDEQGYTNLGSWFFCLTHEGAAVCPNSR